MNKGLLKTTGLIGVILLTMGMVGCGESKNNQSFEIPEVRVEAEGKTEQAIKMERVHKISEMTSLKLANTELDEKTEKIALEEAIKAAKENNFKNISQEQQEKILWIFNYISLSSKNNVRDFGVKGLTYFERAYWGRYNDEVESQLLRVEDYDNMTKAMEAINN